MSSIAKHLAQGRIVRVNARVVRVAAEGRGWVANTEVGEQFSSRGFLLTPPVPRSLALLAVGGFPLRPIGCVPSTRPCGGLWSHDRLPFDRHLQRDLERDLPGSCPQSRVGFDPLDDLADVA